MNKILFWLIILVGVIVLIGNILMLSFFGLTSIGLTQQERNMLMMTSGQISTLYATSVYVLNQTSMFQNATDQLVELTDQLTLLKNAHRINNETTIALNMTSNTQEVEVIAYNATIEQQMSIIQDKIDNITLPASLNLTFDDTTTTIANGTLLLSNPNNRDENTTLAYNIKKQLGGGITFLEIGPMGATLSYTTLGAFNWVGLTAFDPPIFSNTTVGTGSFSFDQVLDDQRDKITVTPPVGKRVYDTDNDEIQLEFSMLLVGGQTITLTEPLEMNVGLILK